MKTGALLVAAGMSSRMKAFKPLLKLGDSTIIGTAILSLQEAGIREIVVITGHYGERLGSYLAALGVTCLYNDRYETTDMFYSAQIGLNYLKDRCGRLFFSPGDVPLFARSSLQLMLDQMDHSDCDILLPTYGGEVGHPILLTCRAIPSLTAYAGAGGLNAAIDRFAGAKEVIELDDMGIILDADRPEDYERLKEYGRAFS